MFSRTAAAEQSSDEYPAVIAAVSPGMIDTGMQERLRKASEDRLPSKDFYINAYKEGTVVPAEEAAERIIKFFSLRIRKRDSYPHIAPAILILFLFIETK